MFSSRMPSITTLRINVAVFRSCRSFSTGYSSRSKVNSSHIQTNIHFRPLQEDISDINTTSGHPTLRQVKVNTKENEESKEKESENSDLVESWMWLSDYGPRFATHGSNVKVLRTPEEYYQVLIDKSKTATRRIVLTSLYVGNGSLENDLVSTLKRRVEEVPGLKINILLDYTRGSRGVVSSRTMLKPLTSLSSCQVFLYHTPTLRGARKKVLPQRWNELIGLQHMKVYVFDNSVLITGANLSNDYFTNRQDRYVLIENCPELGDFYDGLITTVSKFSFRLDSNNNVVLHSECTVDPVNGNVNDFTITAKRSILNYYQYSRTMTQSHLLTSSRNEDGNDTWIFPLIQMGPFGINLDEGATLRIFQQISSGSKIKLATGYFNLTPSYTQAIINNSSAHFQILMAHPKANGFFGTTFPAGGIPSAYTLLAKRFLQGVENSCQEYRIVMKEYLRNGWTFHGKGLWFYPPGETLPLLTLIGSPNFGFRSVFRDLETQLYIVSTNQHLRQAFNSEQQNLFCHSIPFGGKIWTDKDRQVPLWVYLVVRFFKNFF